MLCVCVCPCLASEITFENAEELTEEGKPFLLLFYSPNDTKSIKDFHMNIAAEIEPERGKWLKFIDKIRLNTLFFA